MYDRATDHPIAWANGWDHWEKTIPDGPQWRQYLEKEDLRTPNGLSVAYPFQRRYRWFLNRAGVSLYRYSTVKT